MTCGCLLVFSLIVMGGLSMRFLIGNKKKPVLNVYRMQGEFYLLKYFIMLSMLRVRKIKMILSRLLAPKNNEAIFSSLDQPQPLSTNEHAVDAVYFNGTNSETTWLVCGTARRKNNLVNGFLYLKVQDFSTRLLVSPRLPDTCMWQLDHELGRYEAEGLKLTPIVPMKKWKIEYQGIMRFEDDSSLNMKVTLEAFWTSNLPYYNFATDMDPNPVASAMAKELWTRQYFKNLKKYHQTHYEQFGTLEGKVQIEGQTFPLSIDCMRDHSFGDQRNWKNFHRYVMHFVHLENGDRITVGVICMPITFSRLEVGFITNSKELINHPITNIDFDLYQHGEHGKPPVDYALQFKAGSETYIMQVRTLSSPEFYIGQESECRIVEQLCHFEVNGMKGWGAAEWQYRHYGGLPNQKRMK
ncbi:uncharacterized protein LOC134209615 [Armigeres subalbatus]|uniref:uncharacterized protein LOC134209615 n=1 Tax=Armigeres subalbatus TaxID=124917 RepID=UPI002ED00EAE